jgi:hypothetical protein
VAGDAIGVTLAAQQRNGVLSQHGELSDRLVVPEPETTVTSLVGLYSLSRFAPITPTK